MLIMPYAKLTVQIVYILFKLVMLFAKLTVQIVCILFMLIMLDDFDILKSSLYWLMLYACRF